MRAASACDRKAVSHHNLHRAGGESPAVLNVEQGSALAVNLHAQTLPASAAGYGHLHLGTAVLGHLHTAHRIHLVWFRADTVHRDGAPEVDADVDAVVCEVGRPDGNLVDDVDGRVGGSGGVVGVNRGAVVGKEVEVLVRKAVELVAERGCGEF